MFSGLVASGMFWHPLKDCVTENITSMAQAVGTKREKCRELYKWLQGLMHQKSISREFVAALTRGGTGWRISKRIRPAGRWDKQEDRYRKSWSYVKNVRCHRCHRCYSCRTSTSPFYHPWKQNQNTDEHKKSARETNGMIGRRNGWNGWNLGLGSMLEMVQ